MNHKTVWKAIGVTVIAILAVIMAGRIYTVNVRYPQRMEKEVSQGDFFEVMPGVEMCVVNSRWLSSMDLQKEYEDVWYAEDPNAYKAVEVKIKLKNKSNKRKKISLFKIYIESDQYDWNGSDADLFAAKNNASLEMPLDPGEEKEYTMPYTFLKDNYKKSTWESLDKEGYFLVVKRYPIKIKWKVK